jgi:hypothetical protein
VREATAAAASRNESETNRLAATGKNTHLEEVCAAAAVPAAWGRYVGCRRQVGAYVAAGCGRVPVVHI